MSEVSLNNITRLTFGKRFMNSKGELDEQGLEFKAIGADGSKISASVTEYMPWLRWMLPLEEEALAKLNARRNRLTTIIMEEHTLTRHITGGAEQHFVDALLTLQDEYDLSEDTIIGLLWVSRFVYIFFVTLKARKRRKGILTRVLFLLLNAGYDCCRKGHNFHFS